MDDKLTLAQLADEYAISKDAARARLYRLGLRPTKEHDQDIRSRISGMKVRDAVDFLLDCIDVLTTAQDVEMPIPGMTQTESRIIHYLLRQEGHTVSKDAIYTALYFDRPPDDWPDPKIIDVRICNIRKKLPEGWEIRTHWGHGYVIVRK